MMPAARQRSKVLGRLQYRLAAWLMLAAGLAWVGTLGTAALGLIVADAALDLSETVRSAAPGFLGLLAVCMVAASVIMLRRLTEVRLARRFERLNPELGNVLTNAAQLAGHESITPVAECLRREAVELGRKTSTVTHPWPVAQAPGVIRRSLGRGSGLDVGRHGASFGRNAPAGLAALAGPTRRSSAVQRLKN